jgi:MFS family permease
VGIPFLVQKSANPGYAIGINGLAGNLGVALAAMLTGFLIKWIGWRAAFAVPALFSIGCGVWFALICPPEVEAPAKRKSGTKVALSRAMVARVLAVMTVSAATGSVIFNFTTNGNNQLFAERFAGVLEDPAILGSLYRCIHHAGRCRKVIR